MHIMVCVDWDRPWKCDNTDDFVLIENCLLVHVLKEGCLVCSGKPVEMTDVEMMQLLRGKNA